MLDMILKFIFFAIVGYITEVTYVFILDRKWVNRGFLNGPYIPIYAFGSIFTIMFLTKYYNEPLTVFIMGAVICSLLEYFTSYAMEKIFNQRWWDYSHHKYNINGRVSLLNSTLFGLGCLAIIYILSPLFNKLIAKINLTVKIIIVVIFSLIFLTDFILSSIDAYKTNKNIKDIDKLIKKANEKKKEILNPIKTRILKAYPFLINDNNELIDYIQKLKAELKKKRKKK